MTKECIDCGEPMEIRENRDGEEFWGCTQFPECKHTESLDEEDEEGWDQNNVKYND